MAVATFRIRDFSDEYSTCSFVVEDVAGDGSNWAALLTAIGSLQTALAAATAGHIAELTITASKELVNDTRPASPWAQREIKWLMRYHDDVTYKKYTKTLPCAALELMSDGGDDEVDIVGITAWATLVTWFEANMLSQDGNAITVDGVSVVGRNI